MNIPSFIALILLLGGLVAPLGYATSLFFVFASFSAMAVVPPAWLGGTSLTPGSLAALVFILRAMRMRGVAKETFLALMSPRRLGLLGLFLCVAALGALVFPVLFQDSLFVYGMRSTALEPVAPSMANVTQTGYLFLSVLVAAVFCALLRLRPDFLDTLLKACVWGGFVAILTGFVDMLADAAGARDVLKSLFYTAQYGYSAGSILETRRVLGLTPEPASYGGLTGSFAALLLFFRPACPPSLWRWRAPLVGWGCLAMAFLSASSTAYAAMFVLLALFMLYRLHGYAPQGTLVRKTILRKVCVGLGVAFVGVAVVLTSPGLSSYVVNLVDALIFQKQYSVSYFERAAWTAAGLRAFVESYGLGVGVGSVRTSNFFANILASTGVPGAVLFFLFLASLYVRRLPMQDARRTIMVIAARLSLIPLFAGLFLSGTVPDFGVITGMLFGIIVAFSGKDQALGKGSDNAGPRCRVDNG